MTQPTAGARAPASPPACPACGKPMILRTAKKGPRVGTQFWGCTAYPNCHKTLQIEKAGEPG